MKNAYKRGRKDSAFLFELINTAKDANDDSLAIFINDYFHTQSNLLTLQSISLLALGTEHITDTGFYIFTHYPTEVNKVLGKSQRLNLVCKIVFNDQLYPLLSYNGKITHTGGMIMYHEDSLRKDINWAAIEDEMVSKYKELGEPITINARLNYDEWRHDWADYNTCLLGYTSSDDLDLEFINTKAWNFATYCEEKSLLEAAIKWSSILIKKDPEPYYFLTYSRLLYKAGKVDMAIEQLKQYITLLKAPDEYATTMMEKMQKGEKIK